MLNLEVNPKFPPKKNKLTLVETQQMPDIEKVVSKDEFSCLNWTFTKVEEKYASTFKLIRS